MTWWKACKLASDHHLFKHMPLVLPKTYGSEEPARSISGLTTKVDASQIFENMPVKCQYVHNWLHCMTASTTKNLFYHCPSQATSAPTGTATRIFLCTPRLTSQCRDELKVITPTTDPWHRQIINTVLNFKAQQIFNSYWRCSKLKTDYINRY